MNSNQNQEMCVNSNVVELNSSEWKSLYIPFLPKDLVLEGIPMNTEEAMKDYFENKICIGKVSRVDFVTKQTKVDQTAQAAFVHFENWTSHNGKQFRELIEKHQEIKLYDYFNNEKYRYICFESNLNKNIRRFITVKINKTPIPEVTEVPKNIHQIVNNNILMEKYIEELKQKIEELEKENSMLKEKNQNLENVAVLQ